MLRKLVFAPILALTLIGCGANTETVSESVSDIRDNAPSLAHGSDEDLIELMELSCARLDASGGDFGVFATLAVESGQDGRVFGVVAANAVQSMCPEYAPNLPK